jgi:transcriptional regulator with XRE-family HTH domain
MATDQGPVVSSAILRAALVRLRRDKRLTQEDVAKSLDWSSSKLIRIEGGRSSVTQVDLDALLGKYDATAESKRLHELNKSARGHGWWDAYKGTSFDAEYLNFIGYEAGASFIRQTAMLIPGLLQTREYAEALAAGHADPERLDRVVKLRLQRQRELAERTDPSYQYFVLDESVIRRHIGVGTDPAIMPNQLRSIADQADGSDRLTVRIIPFEAGYHPGLLGSFTLLEFAESLPDVLYLDPGRGTIIFEQESDKVAAYRDDFETLVDLALSADESVDLLRAAAEEMSK